MPENAILIKIGADVAKVQADMGKVSAVVKSHADSMASSFDGLKSKLAGLISIGALAVLAKDAIETADSVQDMSEKFGISTNELSTYMVSAKLVNVDIENIGKGLKFLAKNAVDSTVGIGTASGAFKAMGIDVKDASGNVKPISALLDEVRGKFVSYADGPEKAALAIKLFGREGTAMVPWLSKSAEEIERVNKVARDFGAIMSDEAIGVTAQLADNMDLVAFAGKGMANQFVAGIAPALNQVVEDFVEWATETEALTVAAEGLIGVIKMLVWDVYELVLIFRLAADVIAWSALSVAQWSTIVAKALMLDFKGAKQSYLEASESWKAMLDQMSEDTEKFKASMDAAGFGEPLAIGPQSHTPAPSKKKAAPIVGEAGESDYDKIRKKIEELNAISLTGVAKQFVDLDNKVASFGTEISKSKTLTGEQVRELNALAEATAEAAKQTAFSTALEKLRNKELEGIAKAYSEIDASVKVALEAIDSDKRLTAEQAAEMKKAAIAAGEFAKETYSSAAALKLQDAQLKAQEKHLKDSTDAMIAARDATRDFFNADASPLTKALEGLDRQAEATIQAIRKAYQTDAEGPPPAEAVDEEQAVRDKLEQRRALLLEIGGIEREMALQRAESYASEGFAVDAENEALNAQREAIFNVAMEYGDLTTALAQLNDGMLEHQQALDDTKSYVDAYVDVWREAHKSIGMMALDIGMSIRDGLVSSMSDVIMGAKTAGEAFKELSKAILKMIVDTLLKWIINRTIMAGLEAMFTAEQVKVTTAAAGLIGAAWLEPAYLATVATLGGAAAEGVVALGLGMAAAAGLGMAMKGMEAGLGGGLSDAINGGTGAAFASGTEYVPRTMNALVHEGERILTPEQNKDFTQFIKGDGPAGSGGGDVFLDGHLVGKWLERRADQYGGMKLRFT